MHASRIRPLVAFISIPDYLEHDEPDELRLLVGLHVYPAVPHESQLARYLVVEDAIVALIVDLHVMLPREHCTLEENGAVKVDIGDENEFTHCIAS